MKTIKKLCAIGGILGMIAIAVPQATFAQQALSVYCQANPMNASQNQTVTYTAYPSGGTGSYSFIWSGSDGLTGNSQSVSHSYAYAQGQQSAEVIVFSNNQSQSAYCNSTINYNGSNYPYNGNNYNPLTAYCYTTPTNVNVGDSVTWIGSATGGNYGGYTYSWSGDENLYGTNNITVKNYSTGGTKNATLTVYSNGQSVTANCIVNVNYNGNQYPYPVAYNTQYPTYPTTPYYGNPSAGVYLSQVPYTGAGPSFSVIAFISSLFLWSCAGAYVMVKRHKSKALLFKEANRPR